MKQIPPLHSIVLGLGRFGRLWARLLTPLGTVEAYDPAAPKAEAGYSLLPDAQALHRAIQSCDAVFFCVPISGLGEALTRLRPALAERQKQQPSAPPLWLLDTCSVKVQPLRQLCAALRALSKECAFERGLQDSRESASSSTCGFRVLGLHPMFGPDSLSPRRLAWLTGNAETAKGASRQADLPHDSHAIPGCPGPLRLVICPVTARTALGMPSQAADLARAAQSPELLLWQQRFRVLGLETLVMSAEEHDSEAARTQGLTHLLGRVLEAFGIRESPIATTGYRALCQLREQTCHDTWQLFLDLQSQNSYTSAMRRELQKAFETVYSALARGESPENQEPGQADGLSKSDFRDSRNSEEEEPGYTLL